MEESPSSGANNTSARQEIPRSLRNPKVHYSVHISHQIPRPCVTFCNKVFYGEELFAPSPNPQDGGIDCPRLLIPYIRSYPLHLEAVSSIPNPRTPHAVATGTYIRWATYVNSNGWNEKYKQNFSRKISKEVTTW